MSTLKVTTIQTSAGGAVTLTKQSANKVWLNFKSDDPSIRDSFNITTMTDGGNCNYTHNFTNNMGNDDYSPVGFIKDGVNNDFCRVCASIDGDTFSPSALQIRPAATHASSFQTGFDPGYVCTQINGDLA